MSYLEIKLKSPLSLSRKDCWKLADLLFACDTMYRKETRELVVKDLLDKVKGPMPRDHEDAKHDIRQILASCLNYPGGFEELIDIVSYYEGYSKECDEEGTKQVQKVIRFVEELFVRDADLRKSEQIKKLMSIVAELDVAEASLEELYKVSAPPDLLSNGKWHYPKGLNKVETLSQVLSQLSDTLASEKGVFPLVAFVERLAKRINDPSEKLRKWVDNDATQAWGIDTQRIVDLRKRLEEEVIHPTIPSESGHAYLLIMLELGNGGDRDSYLVKAWLLYGQDETECLHSSENGELYTSDTIPDLLDELLTKVASNRTIGARAKEELRIEFFLPRELFSLQVDNWLVDEATVPLGIRNRVVLRSSERIKDVLNKALWETKWERLHNHSQVADRGAIHWICNSSECDGTKVYIHLRDENVVCLCLTLVPSHIVDPRDKKEMFRMMFKAGTPIALWPKHLPDNHEKVQKIQQMLRSLLSNHKLYGLPDLVLEQRREALKGDDIYHLGHYLTLMWDDPNRLPPEDVKLVETEIRK